MKKRIRKQRLQLNSERVQNEEKAIDSVNKYEKVEKILKNASLGNGLTSIRNAPETVHISGGLMNYIVAYISSMESELNENEVNSILIAD